jgi:hypothetical protein
MLCGAAVVTVDENIFEDGGPGAETLSCSLLLILIRYNDVNRYLDG